ncbi:MAG: methyltransferase domain-containing protein [Candidatus Hydrogenedentes bacterium]|nr:methyltransferase domain-containing protein [Candidatus Hydrogenedentota bacterium]
MTAGPIDYDEIAPRYDRHRRGTGPYSDLLWELARSAPGREFLEIGPGTGNETAAMLEAAPARITGLERSRGMCAQARAKGVAAAWVQGEAEHLPFRNQSFDFLFGAYMLHYLPDLEVVFRECRRVLRPNGTAAFVTVSHEFIRAHPMNRWFPSLAKVDLDRFPDIGRVRAALESAGFRAVDSRDTAALPRDIDTAYADRVAHRFISTYDLLPPAEFDEGLKSLRRDIARGAAGTLVREATLVWGHLPPT